MPPFCTWPTSTPTCPNCFTCDNWQDVERLVLEPQFADYMSEAFKPLGVYVKLLAGAASRRRQAKLPRDAGERHLTSRRGRLELSWEPDPAAKPPAPAAGAKAEQAFRVAALGQRSQDIAAAAPDVPGRYVLTVRAYWDGKPWSPTVSRRKVEVKGR